MRSKACAPLQPPAHKAATSVCHHCGTDAQPWWTEAPTDVAAAAWALQQLRTAPACKPKMDRAKNAMPKSKGTFFKCVLRWLACGGHSQVQSGGVEHQELQALGHSRRHTVDVTRWVVEEPF